jgi:hypothetical protein
MELYKYYTRQKSYNIVLYNNSSKICVYNNISVVCLNKDKYSISSGSINLSKTKYYINMVDKLIENKYFVVGVNNYNYYIHSLKYFKEQRLTFMLLGYILNNTKINTILKCFNVKNDIQKYSVREKERENGWVK